MTVTASRLVLAMAMLLCSAAAWGQAAQRDPHIGYVYPAGGQQGSTFEVEAGGQYLRGANAVYVSGAGVQATVADYIRPLSNKDRGDIAKHLRALTRQRVAEIAAKRGVEPPKPPRGNAKDEELPELPDHPLAKDLATKTLMELAYLRDLIFDPKKQPNAQIAETAIIKVTIDADAPPGDRELRLGTPTGLTNPMVFQVGTLAEVREEEPNGPPVAEPKPLAMPHTQPTFDLPVLLNGQIEPGDVDRFRFRAKQGQRLVIRAQARHLVPYLADAVPGWFQATLAALATWGRELAFVDDFRFDPDPVLLYEVPQDGEYQLEVRDSIYRGREDFVYRVSIAQQPFITHMFPLGGHAGTETVASIGGWNLPADRLSLDTRPGPACIRQTALREGGSLSNSVTYAVDSLPESAEAEPNDTPADAQSVDLPRIVNGRIAKPGDVDVFQFEGRAGEQVVVEVQARRLRSPLDSLLRLMDESGKVLEFSDDHMEKVGHLHPDMGVLTHHADSYLRTRLPADGVYRVQVADAQGQGGEAFAYRLRIGAPQPDFALRVTPSSITLPAGRAAPVTVHVLRKDGFAGDVEVTLKDAPAGFSLQGGRVPAGRDRIRVTVTAPRQILDQPISLHLEGHAQIDGERVSRLAVPAENNMQAFLWRHLVPSQELMVAVMGTRRFAPIITRLKHDPVRISSAGTALVQMTAPRRKMAQEIKLELIDPPEGVSLGKVTVVPGALAFALKTDAAAPAVGYVDNLIVQAFVEVERKGRDEKAPKRKFRVPLGALPAIPIEVVN